MFWFLSFLGDLLEWKLREGWGYLSVALSVALSPSAWHLALDKYVFKSFFKFYFFTF